MTDDRDPELQALFGATRPPAHRPGFWDDVRAEMVGAPTTPDAEVIAMDRFRRRAPWLPAVAALVVVGGVFGFGALRDRSDDVDVTTDPTVDDTGPDIPDDGEPTPDDSTPPTTTDATAGPLVPAGDPIDRGTGRVVGISPDGRWLYVTDDAGTGEFGCESTPRGALYVEPVGGGDRRLATPTDVLDATTVSELHFDGDGRVATVVQCEGFEARIVAATVADDGTLTDAAELTLPEPECHDGTVDGVGDLDYLSPGVLVAATSSFGDDGRVCHALYSLPDTPSEPTLIDAADVIQVEAAPDGRLFTGSVDGEIAMNGDVVHTVSGLIDMELSPAGTALALTHDRDDEILHIEDGQVAGSSVFAVTAYDVTLVDDRAGAMQVDTGDGLVLYSLHLDGDDVLHTLATGQVVAFRFAPDASRLFVSVVDDDGTVRLREQPLTR